MLTGANQVFLPFSPGQIDISQSQHPKRRRPQHHGPVAGPGVPAPERTAAFDALEEVLFGPYITLW